MLQDGFSTAQVSWFWGITAAVLKEQQAGSSTSWILVRWVLTLHTRSSDSETPEVGANKPSRRFWFGSNLTNTVLYLTKKDWNKMFIYFLKYYHDLPTPIWLSLVQPPLVAQTHSITVLWCSSPCWALPITFPPCPKPQSHRSMFSLFAKVLSLFRSKVFRNSVLGDEVGLWETY